MKHKSLPLPTILIFSLFALCSCFLAPLRTYLAADYVLKETYWFTAVDFVWMHLEAISSVILLTFVTFGIYCYQLHGCKHIFLISILSLAFKYISAIIAFSFVNGSLDLTGKLNVYIISFLFEIALIVPTIFLSHRLITPYQLDYKAKESAAILLNRPFEQKPLYPFQKIFSLKNPLQRVIFFNVIIVAACRIISDIPSTFQYGIFDTLDIYVTLITWFVLILLPAFYSYFLALPFFKLCVKCTKE